MYTCEKCGENYRGNFGKCANCGGEIVIAPPRPTWKQRFAAKSIQAKTTPKKTTQKIRRRKKDFIIFFIVAGIIALVFFTTKSTPSTSALPGPTNNVVANEATSAKRPGDITVLRHNALIAVNDDAYAAFGKFSSANNKDEIARMITSGRLVLVGIGAKITITKVNGDISFVEVTDGPTTGTKGWLLNSLMR